MNLKEISAKKGEKGKTGYEVGYLKNIHMVVVRCARCEIWARKIQEFGNDFSNFRLNMRTLGFQGMNS